MRATAMSEPEWQYDTSGIASVLPSTICRIILMTVYVTLLQTIVFDLLNDDSATVCSLLNRYVFI
ncbi:hypothetical protein TSAR_007550 [Trichomalopsis sarcophagae]|uniref:Uncharacterized protein n=1 Tax=Trichomalopsis sarcophagae TaxID=543379 RepID=A0A232ESZ4_9HYME|nr:hypothetical protein TSAR_007550 [Trichomalopsis sarcophagae]